MLFFIEMYSLLNYELISAKNGKIKEINGEFTSLVVIQREFQIS